MRLALGNALLITHRQFWDKYKPARKDMGKADTTRRKVLAMQFYMRLYLLVACKGALTSTAASPVHMDGSTLHRMQMM